MPIFVFNEMLHLVGGKYCDTKACIGEEKGELVLLTLPESTFDRTSVWVCMCRYLETFVLCPLLTFY